MRTIIVVAALLLLAAPLAAADFWAEFDPDAAIVAEPVGVDRDSLFGASKIIDEAACLAHRRVWGDLFQPLDDLGAGLSVDIVPGKAACAGVGWQREWFGYVGGHFEF